MFDEAPTRAVEAQQRTFTAHRIQRVANLLETVQRYHGLGFLFAPGPATVARVQDHAAEATDPAGLRIAEPGRLGIEFIDERRHRVPGFTAIVRRHDGAKFPGYHAVVRIEKLDRRQQGVFVVRRLDPGFARIGTRPARRECANDPDPVVRRAGHGLRALGGGNVTLGPRRAVVRGDKNGGGEREGNERAVRTCLDIDQRRPVRQDHPLPRLAMVERTDDNALVADHDDTRALAGNRLVAIRTMDRALHRCFHPVHRQRRFAGRERQ